MFATWALLAYEDHGLGVFAAVEMIEHGRTPADLALQKRVVQGQKKRKEQTLLIMRAPFKRHIHAIEWRADYSVVVKQQR